MFNALDPEQGIVHPPTHSTEEQRKTPPPDAKKYGLVSLRDRIHHFTWAEYTATMSTGGLALLLAQTPNRFGGLVPIGDVVFIIDLVLFLLFTSIITSRFFLFRGTMLASLSDPTESLFFGTFWLSVNQILSNAQLYGVPRCGPWLIVALRVCFWIYAALTTLVAIGQYYFLFSGKPTTVQSFTTAWVLPIFPAMLVGTLASVLGRSQPPHHALPIVVAGITFQGLGMFVSVIMSAVFVTRLMVNGFPEQSTRPGMFIAVGPPAFTALALLGLSQDMARIYPDHNSISGVQNQANIPDIFRIVAVSVGIFLWSCSFWFFSLAAVATVIGALEMKHPKNKAPHRGMRFHLTWWSFVFPNVGFTIATIDIGEALESAGIKWVTSAMTIMLFVMWLFVGTMHIRAVWLRQILWEGNDEDKNE